MREIRRADIVLVLYTGEAGWAVDHREMGICHAELHEALERRGDVVALFGIEPLHRAQDERDRRFQAWVNRLNLFRGSARNEEELGELVIEHLYDRIAELVHLGASGDRRRDRGQALDWAELELAERRIEMTAALARVLSVDRGVSDQLAQIEIAGTTFSARLDAIPAALSIPAARNWSVNPFFATTSLPVASRRRHRESSTS